MSLSSAKSKLEKDIKKAYSDSKKAGAVDGANPDSIINTLANGIGNAIHNFMLQAQVSVTVSVPPEMTSPPPAASLIPTTCMGKGNLT